MKPKTDKDSSAALAGAAKVANADELTDFMDAVAARLDLYDEAAADMVVARPTKETHY